MIYLMFGFVLVQRSLQDGEEDGYGVKMQCADGG